MLDSALPISINRARLIASLQVDRFLTVEGGFAFLSRFFMYVAFAVLFLIDIAIGIGCGVLLFFATAIPFAISGVDPSALSDSTLKALFFASIFVGSILWQCFQIVLFKIGERRGWFDRAEARIPEAENVPHQEGEAH